MSFQQRRQVRLAVPFETYFPLGSPRASASEVRNTAYQKRNVARKRWKCIRGYTHLPTQRYSSFHSRYVHDNGGQIGIDTYI